LIEPRNTQRDIAAASLAEATGQPNELWPQKTQESTKTGPDIFVNFRVFCGDYHPA
jgi:hypothetical protein